MNAPHQMVTRSQLQVLLKAWKCDEEIPGRGKQLVIAFPPGCDIRTVIVKPTGTKGTYGDALFGLTFSNERFPIGEPA